MEKVVNSCLKWIKHAALRAFFFPKGYWLTLWKPRKCKLCKCKLSYCFKSWKRTILCMKESEKSHCTCGKYRNLKKSKEKLVKRRQWQGLGHTLTNLTSSSYIQPIKSSNTKLEKRKLQVEEQQLGVLFQSWWGRKWPLHSQMPLETWRGVDLIFQQ